MGAWNTDSGASIHSELIGREWVKAGHQLAVFSFYEYSIHGTALTNDDEDYVYRCFTTSNHPNVKLDPIPFLREEYEIFVVEDLGMLPQDQLRKIFHGIKRKAKTLTVIHDGKLSEDPSFYQFEWDAIVGFDERYIKFLKEGYPEELINQIPYPCYPLNVIDKMKAREMLHLPKDKNIIFMFGSAAAYGIETIPWIEKICANYPIMILIVSKDRAALTKASEYLGKIDVNIREETLTISKLYDYLHASDALIYNKPSQKHVTVSSTVFQCLGSGCPIIARESGFIENMPNIILKFNNENSFRNSVINVLEQREKYHLTMKEAKEYVFRNSSKIVADKFISLFRSLM
jgi:hypothetical protein